MYKCWICDVRGRDLRRIVRKFGSFLQLQEWDELTNRVNLDDFEHIFEEKEPELPQKLPLPEEFISLTRRNLPLSALQARNYLKGRGITKEDILRWKIGYCSSGAYAGRIIVPSFGEEGYANYFVARSYAKAYPRYKNPPASRDIVFNHLYVDWDDDLVIVEGVFDAIVAGPNTIPILGSSLRENSKLFQEIVKHDTPVYIALDPDMEKKAMYLIKNLLTYDVEVRKIDIEPYGDVGEMSKSEFLKRKSEAVVLNSDNYLLYHMTSLL